MNITVTIGKMPITPLAQAKHKQNVTDIAAEIDPEVAEWFAKAYKEKSDLNKKLMSLINHPMAKVLL